MKKQRTGKYSQSVVATNEYILLPKFYNLGYIFASVFIFLCLQVKKFLFICVLCDRQNGELDFMVNGRLIRTVYLTKNIGIPKGQLSGFNILVIT